MAHAFEHAFAHAAIGMALVDMEGRFLRVNEAPCRIEGHTRKHLEHRPLRELSHPADVDLVVCENSAEAGSLDKWRIRRKRRKLL